MSYPTSNFLLQFPYVVYFDKQIHACACVWVVENNEKDLKIKKSTCFFMHTRGSCKAHEETGLQPVSRPVEQISVFFKKVLKRDHSQRI